MMNWAFSKARGKVVDDENRTIAVVTACGRKLAEADRIGYLLAAAPELLEALEEVAKLPIAPVYPDGPCVDKETMAEIRAAIAKAKGGTP